MHKLLSLASGFIVLALGASLAYAADKKMVPEEGAVEIMILRQQSVQRELNLTDEQVEKIHKHGAAQWEKAQKASKLSESEADKKFIELTKENEKFVEQTLNKDQQKRLHEIVLQVAGLLCLTREHVASKLNLTADQKKRAMEMQKEGRQEAEELIHATSKEQKREKLKELRASTRKRVTELLTDDQEAKWKEMTGKPFTGDLAFFDPDDKTTK
jgi:Spy/CpxP family protein refolding chaperone